jgi:uncharacterized protein (DUF433 family)
MATEGLEHYSKDQLVEELINRQTFAGLVIFHRGDAKAGNLEAGEIVLTKSPPLTQQGVEELLTLGQTLVPGMFGKQTGDIQPATLLPGSADSYALTVTPDGVARVGNSRVSLDLIVEHYENGMTPEEIVRGYDTLKLSDAYGAIAYYLRHTEAVRAYLSRRETEATALRQKIEADRGRISREELTARSAAEKQHAASGQ